MAQQLSFAALVRYGSELCATFVRDDFSATGLSERPALASKESIKRFLRGAKGLDGVAEARKAVAFICENAASPREIASTLIFTLPFRYGGYGLPMPRLNYVIDVHKYDAAFASKSFYKADLCWPDKKVIVEYESDQWHTGADKIAEDSRRRNALIAMGFTVVTVTNAQIKSPLETERVAFLLARLLGHRIRIRSKLEFAIKSDMLREALL